MLPKYVHVYIVKSLTLMVAMARAGVQPLRGAPSEEPKGAGTTDFVNIRLDIAMKHHHRASTQVAKVLPEVALFWL